MFIALTDGEIDWLIYTCDVEEFGQDFRAKLFAHRMNLRKSNPPIYGCIMDLTLEELWMIDGSFFINEVYTNHLFDQTPMLVFADKIWSAIATAEGEMKERNDSRDTTYAEAKARTEAEGA